MPDFSLIQVNADNPTLITVMYTMIFALLLSILLAFTYEKTSRDLTVPGNFIQSMILSSLVAATIMQAIGDSLARGLGMLGALAIIRFRTTLREPRNIIFMFAALAAGIACGVYGFNVAFIGTVTFCLVAAILRWTPFSKETNMVCDLRFTGGYQLKNQSLPIFKEFCKKVNLSRMEASLEDDQAVLFEYQYKLVLKKKGVEESLLKAISTLENISEIRLNIRNQPEIF